MKIVFKIAVIIVIVLLALLGLDKIYAFGLKHNQNIKIVNVTLDPKNAQLLVHGPCEPLWMICPGMLDSITEVPSYNLALSHSDFADNYLHLYFYLKSNRPPEFLLLYVTPESFDEKYNTFNTYRFAPYLEDSIVAAVVKENDPAYYKWHSVPFMRYAYYNNRMNFEMIQGWKHFFTKRKTAYYEDGFEPPATRVWGNHAGEFAKLYEDNTIFTTDSLRVKYLLKTIRLAKQYHIKTYLYESPVLYEALAFQPNRGKMIQFIEEVAEKENIRFIKFDSLEMAKNRKYFISTLNFNMEGIRIFNDTLGKYIRTNIINQSTDTNYTNSHK